MPCPAGPSIVHIWGRVGAIDDYVGTLNPDNLREIFSLDKGIYDFIKYMETACSHPDVTLTKFIVKQYKNQIPALLRRSVVAATSFIRKLANHAPQLASNLLKEGKMQRQYIEGLANVMSTLSGIAASEFYFVAQHIIETLSESYGRNDNRFGKVTINNVHMGPGSTMPISSLAFPWNRPKLNKKEDPYRPMSQYLHQHEADCIMERLRNLSEDELKCLGLFQKDSEKDKNGKKVLRVILTHRLVTYIYIEHGLCKLYIFFKYKCPLGMLPVEPALDVPHCYPVKYNQDKLDLTLLRGVDGQTVGKIGNDATSSFAGLQNWQMPWKMLLNSECPETPTPAHLQAANDEFFNNKKPQLEEAQHKDNDAILGISKFGGYESKCGIV